MALAQVALPQGGMSTPAWMVVAVSDADVYSRKGSAHTQSIAFPAWV
jgi:hypothetical protein